MSNEETLAIPLESGLRNKTAVVTTSQPKSADEKKAFLKEYRAAKKELREVGIINEQITDWLEYEVAPSPEFTRAGFTKFTDEEVQAHYARCEKVVALVTELSQKGKAKGWLFPRRPRKPKASVVENSMRFAQRVQSAQPTPASEAESCEEDTL